MTPIFSLRGSLADDISKQLRQSGYQVDALSILADMLRANPNAVTCIPEGRLLKIGRVAEIGQFPPDW